jgi:CHAT domain-containing protein
MIILYNNIANNYLNLNNFKKAQYYYYEAYKISKNAGLKGTFISALLKDMGVMEEKQHNYLKALDYYQTAIKMLVPGFITENSTVNLDVKKITAQLPVLNLLKAKTNCLHRLYTEYKNFQYLDAAINTSLLSMKIIESLRNGYQTYESKIALSGSEDNTYKNALLLCNEAYTITKDPKYADIAFTISEKNKASALISDLRELKAKNFGEIPDSLLYKENQLKKEIAFYKEKIYEETRMLGPDSNKIKTWNNYLFNKQKENDQLISLFEKKYPGYYTLKYDNSTVQTDQLRKIIPCSTSLIEYSLTDSVLYTFIFTRQSYTMLSQKIDSNFYQLINSYLKEYHQFDFSKQDYSGFTEFCWKNKEIFDILIKPAANILKTDNLIIVPDGILSFLPFETLIDELPESLTNVSYKDLKYLLLKYSISYAYSSTFYCQVIDQKAHKNSNRLLAFAPEYGPNSTVDMRAPKVVTRQKYRRDLYPIPGVMDEVAAIKSILPSDVYAGISATESNFKKVSGNYDILHLAMHTVIDNENPMYSKLIFTQSEDSLNDGLLNTNEIFGLKLKAKMVVLSACSSGEGGFSKGEGVVSLARGFVYAGCPSLLMTLWEVEDKSSVLLMKYYYTGLIKGESKATSLKNAKLKFLKGAKAENSHPFFWSSFVLMGNTDPIYYSVWVIVIPVALILLIILIFIFRKLNRMRKEKLTLLLNSWPEE